MGIEVTINGVPYGTNEAWAERKLQLGAYQLGNKAEEIDECWDEWLYGNGHACSCGCCT